MIWRSGQLHLFLPLLIVACFRISAGIKSSVVVSQTGIEKHIRKNVRAWFTIAETELKYVNYSQGSALNCTEDAYINALIHIQKGSWSVVCFTHKGSRWDQLAKILDTVVPTIPHVDVLVPFGLHDGVAIPKLYQQGTLVPILGTVYHPDYSPLAIPFAGGCERDLKKPYVNTPVVGWDRHVKAWLSCNGTAPAVNRAVFRGKALNRSHKYGTCSMGCSPRDNGRLLMHSLGQEHPDKFDTAVTNADQFNVTNNLVKPQIPFPDQLCLYKAILNIGNNVDWAERLRQSFYGNAVIMMAENPPQEFFTSFMQPYVHYWPTKPDLSDVVDQVERVLALPDTTGYIRHQREFAAKFLTEEFMLKYNRILIEEYNVRAQQSAKRTWTAPSGDAYQRARELLKMRTGSCSTKCPREKFGGACTLQEASQRKCPDASETGATAVLLNSPHVFEQDNEDDDYDR